MYSTNLDFFSWVEFLNFHFPTCYSNLLVCFFWLQSIKKFPLFLIQDHHYHSQVETATTFHCLIYKQLSVQSKTFSPPWKKPHNQFRAWSLISEGTLLDSLGFMNVKMPWRSMGKALDRKKKNKSNPSPHSPYRVFQNECWIHTFPWPFP